MDSFRLDEYVVDVLLRDLVGHEHSPAAFLVYLFLWRHVSGRRDKSVRMSHNQIAQDTALSKSAVQRALRVLRRRGLVRSDRRHDTDTPLHTVARPWLRRSATKLRN
jgi:DNA-binding MarR family transcriptional regulator